MAKRTAVDDLVEEVEQAVWRAYNRGHTHGSEVVPSPGLSALTDEEIEALIEAVDFADEARDRPLKAKLTAELEARTRRTEER